MSIRMCAAFQPFLSVALNKVTALGIMGNTMTALTRKPTVRCPWLAILVKYGIEAVANTMVNTFP